VAEAARTAYRFVVGLFVLACIAAFFLAGAGAFRATDSFESHRTIGGIVVGGAALLFLLSLATRERRLILLSLVLLADGIIQGLLAQYDTWLGAFHPVNGLLVLGLGLYLAHRAWQQAPAT